MPSDNAAKKILIVPNDVSEEAKKALMELADKHALEIFISTDVGWNDPEVILARAEAATREW